MFGNLITCCFEVKCDGNVLYVYWIKLYTFYSSKCILKGFVQSNIEIFVWKLHKYSQNRVLLLFGHLITCCFEVECDGNVLYVYWIKLYTFYSSKCILKRIVQSNIEIFVWKLHKYSQNRVLLLFGHLITCCFEVKCDGNVLYVYWIKLYTFYSSKCILKGIVQSNIEIFMWKLHKYSQNRVLLLFGNLITCCFEVKCDGNVLYVYWIKLYTFYSSKCILKGFVQSNIEIFVWKLHKYSQNRVLLLFGHLITCCFEVECDGNVLYVYWIKLYTFYSSKCILKGIVQSNIEIFVWKLHKYSQNRVLLLFGHLNMLF